MTGNPARCGFSLNAGKKSFRKRFYAFSLFFFIFCCDYSFSQHADFYRPVLWDVKDGLSLGKKNRMLKDVNGFMWIISPVGLNRFDGSTFKIYTPDKNTPGTIAGSYGFSMVEDSLHNIWFGTNKGLSRYDIKTDTFKNFPPTAIQISTVATAIPFWATKDDVYCLESGLQLTVYNARTLEKKLLMDLTRNKYIVNNVTIPQSIYDEDSKSVWMLTGAEGEEGGGLIQILLQDKKIVQHEWRCYKNIPNHNHHSYGMHYDRSRKSIWINSSDGLLEFTVADKKFHEIPACNDLMDFHSYETMAGIDIDLQGKIWVCTQAKGIVQYDPTTLTVTPLFNDSVLQHKVSDENMSIYCDRDGMIWCGYLPEKGMYQFIPFSSSVTRLPLNLRGQYKKDAEINNPFTSIIQRDADTIWIGSIYGLSVYNKKTNTAQQLTEKDFPGLTGSCIAPLAVDTTHQKAWLSAWPAAAIYEMDLRTGTCIKMPIKDLSQNEITAADISPRQIGQYKNGFNFLIDRKGIFNINSNSKSVQQILAIPYHVTNIAFAGEKRIFARLHFAYTNLSFQEVNGNWTKTATALDSIEWSCIFYDEVDQSYWAGGVKQLYHYSKDFKLIRRYSEKDGIPGIDVLSIVKDNLGNIWFNNSAGDISRINSETDILNVLTEKDGYNKQVFHWMPAHLKSSNGDLFFCGEDGVDRIHPGNLDSIHSSTVYLQSIQVNQQPITGNKNINDLQQLSLQYFESFVTIETGVIDYYSKGKSTIRYKLKGINDNWQYAPANYTIRFEKLPPGKYTLVIQASNSGNNFEGPEKNIVIQVIPAIWNTWWFRLISFVAIIILIYALMRFRLKEKFKLQLEHSRKDKELADMRQQTAQLEMQALRAQMNPHFIFNSLNSINRFILQNNREHASEYLTKFSRLVRLILQNSQASLITLESELESLQLYLELESLRFDYHFNYKITVQPDLDISMLKIPPLIIQPFAENAIWHGLMHKEEKGQLDIEITQAGNNIYLKISDDGVGRKKSAALSSKSATRHKSMGLQITTDRIAMIQSGISDEPAVKIVDLVAADGTGAGTEVIIKIPVMYD